MAKQVDVLICGGGSAGLCAAVWLARCGIDYKILERRPGPLTMGQADGVQCRTVEIFESFGLSEDLLKEAYHVLELAFWGPDEKGGIKRTHYAADLEPGLSHLPHVILNQARVNALLTEEMVRASGQSNIEYGYEVQRVEVDSSSAQDPEAHCVSVTATKDGVDQVFQAKYLLGSDGAHSMVRKSLGFKMVGDSTNSLWGVMDVYPSTNFPDIRKKSAISSNAGNLMIIPREGDNMVRFYIEIENAAAESTSLEKLHDCARRIFSPYKMEIIETTWWSAYSIGQRRADFFTKENRVFLTGDACHTHSPKAGAGMNVSLQDGYNIGWKLAAVLRGQAAPKLLETYVSEREKTATELIEFDRYWSKLFSSSYRRENGITPEHFQEQFIKGGRYTAGQAVHYDDSIIISSNSSEKAIVKGLTVGMRFPSAQVVRFCDARAMQLVRALSADSRWHIVVFGGDLRDTATADRLNKVSRGLDDIIRHFTPPGADPDSIINALLVLSGKRTETEQEQIPELFTPVTGKRRMKCLFKTFVDDESYNSGHGHAYKSYGIEPSQSILVIVRPDHYVARVDSLDDVEGIRIFFAGFLKPGNEHLLR